MSDQGLKKCCVTGHVHAGEPQGEDTTVGGLPCYVATPKPQQANGPAIVLLSDVFGYKFANARLVADEYAKAGFVAYLPDLLDGDAMDPAMLPSFVPWPEQKEDHSKDGYLAMAGNYISKAGSFAKIGVEVVPFLYRHRRAATLPKLETFLPAVKKSHNKLYAVGFCWGAQYCFLGAHADNTISGFFDATAAIHPSATSDADITNITKPIFVGAGSIDEAFDWKAKKDLIEKAKGELKVYEGMQHGFALRGDLDKPYIRKGKEEVHNDVLNFFRLH